MNEPRKQRSAAGILLHRRGEDGREWLILENARHGTWSFPKGHRDAADADDLACARRELEEETGLTDIALDPDFEERSSYVVRDPQRGRYDKTVVWFLAELLSGRLRLSPEHAQARWVSFEEARATLQFPDLERTLTAAHQHLRARAKGETT